MELDVTEEGKIQIQTVSSTMCLSFTVCQHPLFLRQRSTALPVPLGQHGRRVGPFTHLLGAELTRNGGNLYVLAFLILPAGNRKCKCQNFIVNSASKSIMFCFAKTRILVLAEAKMIALKQSDAVICDVHCVYTYVRCKQSNMDMVIYYVSQIKMKH